MLGVGKSDNSKCLLQVKEQFLELFANKIGKRNSINESSQTFGPVGFGKEVRFPDSIRKQQKTPTILLIP